MWVNYWYLGRLTDISPVMPRARWRSVRTSLVMAGSAVALACTSQPAAQQTRFKPVATVYELMEATVEPASYVIFDAAVWSNGELVGAPTTDEEWVAVEHGALTLAESGNLLMMAPRAMDDGPWMQMSLALVDAAMAAYKAAQSKDVEKVLHAGSAVYDTCTNCHATYLLRAQAAREAADEKNEHGGPP